MSGALDGLLVGPWRTDSETGYRVMDYVSCGSQAAMAYQGVCDHAGKFQWAVTGPAADIGAVPGTVHGGFALTVALAEAEAADFLRSLGAVLTRAAVQPLDTEPLRALMESWLTRAAPMVPIGGRDKTLDRCAADLLKLIEAAEDDADDELLGGVSARMHAAGVRAGMGIIIKRLRAREVTEGICADHADRQCGGREKAAFHCGRRDVLAEMADAFERRRDRLGGEVVVKP